MPQTVEIPEHGVAEFPDEMSPDEIKGVIQKKFYAPVETKVPRGTEDNVTANSLRMEPSASRSLTGILGKALGFVQGTGKEAFSGFLPPEMMQAVFGGSESSLRPEERSKPLIPPASAKEIVGQLPEWAGGNTKFAQGIAEGTTGALSEFSKPSAIAQIPEFAVPGVAETYAANVVAGLPEQYSKLRDAIKTYGLGSKEAGTVAAESGIQDLMGFLAVKGGALAREAKPTLTEMLFPSKPQADGLTQKLAPILGEQPEPTIPAPVRPVEAPRVESPTAIEQAPMSEVIAPETPSPAPTEPTIADATGTEAVQATPPTVEPKRFRPPHDGFGSELTPVASAIINDLGGMKSKSAAKRSGEFERNGDLWDDPAVLQHPTHNKIYNLTGQLPDSAATELYNMGLIREPSVQAMNAAISHESQTARTVVTEQRAQSAAEKVAHAEWQDQLKAGEQDPAIPLVYGENAAMITKSPDGNGVELSILGADGEPTATETHPTVDAALKSAHELGMRLDDKSEHGQAIFDEAAPSAGNGDATKTRETTGAPQEVVTAPKLRVGEKQGDLLSGQTEDLTLVGEKGIDHGAQQAEAEKAVVAADDTRRIQDKLQRDLPLTPDEAAQPEATKNGVYPAERVVAGSTNPAEAAELSPQALGITHPLPGFLKSAVDYFTKNAPSQIWNTIKGSVDAALGKTFAKTTIADRQSGELAARWISSRIAAPHLAETFSTNVLEGTGVDPVKFGAALTEDNLRSVRKTAESEGRPEDAANVTTIIGAKNSPFKTEAEYKAFLADPATQAAIERHRALWAETIDPMFRQAQNLEPGEPLPSRGDETGARINLYNDPEAKGSSVVSGTGQGNLTATMRKKSPFAIQAKGTGQSYNVDYNAIMANTFGRQLEIANKNAFEKQLVDSGNAIIGKPAKDVTLPDGEATTAFPLKRTVLIDTADGKKIPVSQNIYVRKSLAGEYRRGADVDLLKVPALVRGFNNAVNKAALAGLTDASVHVLNLSTALLTRPSIVGGVLTDSLLSVTGRADVPFTLAKAITKGMQDNRAQLAELAEIGALKGEQRGGNPLGKVIGWADRTTRLVLDDAFKNMADAGLVERTETNRREFVNQVGQYNKKAQGDLRRLARDSGFGPFATAGTTFNTLGIRTITGSPAIPATSAMAAASLRANVMSKWVGGAVLVGALNYILTKDKGGGVLGRPGVPLGKVDTGLNDENGRPLSIPVFAILGLERGLRVTGARGFIESQRKGLSLQNGLDSAATDIWNTNVSPFTGPVIRFAGVASSGKQLPAINVPRSSPVVPPGESQAKENLKQAIIDANPILKSLHLATEPGQGTRAAVLQQIPRLTLQPSQSAEFMAKYPEIVRKAQAREFINDVIGRARKMNPADQENFVRESLSKLAPEDQEHAKRTLKYSRIRY